MRLCSDKMTSGIWSIRTLMGVFAKACFVSVSIFSERCTELQSESIRNGQLLWSECVCLFVSCNLFARKISCPSFWNPGQRVLGLDESSCVRKYQYLFDCDSTILSTYLPDRVTGKGLVGPPTVLIVPQAAPVYLPPEIVGIIVSHAVSPYGYMPSVTRPERVAQAALFGNVHIRTILQSRHFVNAFISNLGPENPEKALDHTPLETFVRNVYLDVTSNGGSGSVDSYTSQLLHNRANIFQHAHPLSLNELG
jgi:hypothetical protein